MSYMVIIGILVAIAANVNWVGLINGIINAISQRDQLIAQGAITKEEARESLVKELITNGQQGVISGSQKKLLDESDARWLTESGLKLYRFFGKKAIERVEKIIAYIRGLSQHPVGSHQWYKDVNLMSVYDYMRDKLGVKADE